MKGGGILEILLVSAEGLKEAHLLGHQSLYVVIQCGNQTHKSKITTGKDNKVWWNEKLIFMLSSSECQELKQLTLRIMELDKFIDAFLVGETKVHLGGLLREASQDSWTELRPTPYNVVLADGKYKGEIKLGLKFSRKVEELLQKERTLNITEKQPQPLYRIIFSLAFQHIRWPRLFFFQKHMNSAESNKDK